MGSLLHNAQSAAECTTMNLYECTHAHIKNTCTCMLLLISVLVQLRELQLDVRFVRIY